MSAGRGPGERRPKAGLLPAGGRRVTAGHSRDTDNLAEGQGEPAEGHVSAGRRPDERWLKAGRRPGKGRVEYRLHVVDNLYKP